MAVGAGHRRGEDVADGHVGRHLGVSDDHVAGLAVLADDGDGAGRRASAARTRNAS